MYIGPLTTHVLALQFYMHFMSPVESLLSRYPEIKTPMTRAPLPSLVPGLCTFRPQDSSLNRRIFNGPVVARLCIWPLHVQELHILCSYYIIRYVSILTYVGCVLLLSINGDCIALAYVYIGILVCSSNDSRSQMVTCQ